MKNQLFTEIIAGLLVTLFLYASISKLLEIHLYISDMHKQPLPGWLTNILLWAIPGIEILTGIGLAFEKTRLAALYASAAMMFSFTLYVALILSFFFGKIPCSCGGAIRSLTWQQHMWLNIVFLLLSISGIVLQRKQRHLDNKPGSTLLSA